MSSLSAQRQVVHLLSLSGRMQVALNGQRHQTEAARPGPAPGTQ
jgi:hypothetical protein